MTFSCQDDFIENSDLNASNTTAKSSKSNNKIGKKLKNPYSVENMRKALKKIKENNPSKFNQRTVDIISDFEITPSHLYVMFDPQTPEAEAIIKQDSTLVVADYPLDYEFTDEELASRTALLEGEIPDYYAAILIDSEVATEAQYQLMDELYIPEEDPYFADAAISSGKTKDSEIANSKEELLRLLLNEAYTLTGNEAQLETPQGSETSRWIFGTRWWPSGTITMFDEVAQRNVPVQGAQVLMRQWFTVRQAITDANGYFKTSSVRGSARYILQWERYNYSIRNGSFFQAETRGPKVKQSQWNLNITGGDDKFFSTIHQAAYHYYYQNIKNLRRPPGNSYFRPQMKIGARFETNNEINGNHSSGERFLGILSRIDIYNPNNSIDKIYATTIHELAHASHWYLDRSCFNNTDKNVKESWARGVELELTKMRYPVYRTSYFENYTGIVEDLIDNNTTFANSIFIGSENVFDYNIKQLEDSLHCSLNWVDWRNKIRNNYENNTENNLDTVFNYWFNGGLQ